MLKVLSSNFVINDIQCSYKNAYFYFLPRFPEVDSRELYSQWGLLDWESSHVCGKERQSNYFLTYLNFIEFYWVLPLKSLKIWPTVKNLPENFTNISKFDLMTYFIHVYAVSEKMRYLWTILVTGCSIYRLLKKWLKIKKKKSDFAHEKFYILSSQPLNL